MPFDCYCGISCGFFIISEIILVSFRCAVVKTLSQNLAVSQFLPISSSGISSLHIGTVSV